jgi:hypothetical protein
MTARVMPLAYATGICATHVRGADARTNERTDADNYSTCEDILLLSNAHERSAQSVISHRHPLALEAS